jgi:hypothetical protein
MLLFFLSFLLKTNSNKKRNMCTIYKRLGELGRTRMLAAYGFHPMPEIRLKKKAKE